MKRFYLFLLCMAITLPGLIAKPHDAKPLKLKGTLSNPTLLKSAPVAEPVAAYLDADNIRLEFGSSLGNLTVIVVNQYGFPVYQQTVNATAGSSFTIDTRSWSNGGYTLVVTNTSGGYLEGPFDINR